jgi:queuine tRNA-ribosyltransferase
VGLAFNVLSTTAAGGRRGQLHLPHRTVETPVFMPVGTLGTVKAVPQNVLEELGAEIILGNTYHLYLRPGHEPIRRMGGLHRFISWPRALLTDSGGFQVFSLSQLRKVSDEGVRFRSHLDGSSHFFTPEHSIDVQIALGADICMAFDECTEYPASRGRAEESLRLTMAWARRSLDHFRAHCHEVPWFNDLKEDRVPGASGASTSGTLDRPRRQSLFGIVQGGTYRDLRRESAERLVEMDHAGSGFDGYAIGGLSVGEPREQTLEMIAEVLPLLPANKPRYVMGVGYPDEIELYARMGVEMMDCVLPTRAARHGLLFTSEGRLNIKGKKYSEDQAPPDPACSCPVCRRYSRAYLRHLMHSGEALSGTLNSIHNLAYYLGIMERVRKSLHSEGKLRFLDAGEQREQCQARGRATGLQD